jgi:hypothetical protein
VKAEDYLDDIHFAEMSAEEKLEKKSSWLRPRYHVKKTNGVPTLLPLVYNLPLKLLGADYGGQHTILKEKGVHNQGRCILKGWDLHESDAERVQASKDKSIVLEELLNASLF